MKDAAPARSPLSGWFQMGIGLGGLGILVLVGTAYYWFLLIGPGDVGGILWSRAGLLLAVPLALGVAAIIVLARRKRVGFLIATAQLVAILIVSFSPTSMMGSSLATQALVAVGVVLSIVGFLRCKTH